MKISLFLLISVFNIISFIHAEEDYSIYAFINQIIGDRFYYLLKEIKNSFGNQVAIEACLQIYPTNDCEKVVNVYIDNYGKYSFTRGAMPTNANGNITPTDKEPKNVISDFELLKSLLYSYNGPLKIRINFEQLPYKIRDKILAKNTGKKIKQILPIYKKE